MRPIPILMLIQHLDNGGTERHFHDLARGLDRSRFEVHVIHFGPGGMARRLAELGWLPITHLPLERATDLHALRAALAIRRYIDRHGIELVLTFHFVADFVATLAGLGRRRPLLVQSRRDMGFTRTSRQLTLGRLIDRRVAGYIAVSEAVRQAMATQEHINPAKTRAIHNGTDFESLRGQAQQWDLAAERERLGISPGETVIGCVANFNPVKGHLVLLEALARLHAAGNGAPRPRLLLAGTGPLKDQIHAAVDRLGLGDAVLLVGRSTAVAREYQLSDFVVLPSETEGFSNTIVEAMAFGRPVVACRVGGNPEAIDDGVTGLLVPPRDPAALAAALADLAADPDRRRAMGERARQAVSQRFSLETMLRNTEDYLLELLGRPRPQPAQPVDNRTSQTV